MVFFGVLDGQFLMCYSDYGKSKFLSYLSFKLPRNTQVNRNMFAILSRSGKKFLILIPFPKTEAQVLKKSSVGNYIL